MNSTCNTQGHTSAYGHYRTRHHQEWRRRPKFNVPVNIEEKEQQYEVSVYATGFDKENIKLTVSGDDLYINGTRTTDENFKPVFIKQEFPVRSFQRILFLNGLVNTEEISARQENGILIITLPKIAGSAGKAQEINIS